MNRRGWLWAGSVTVVLGVCLWSSTLVRGYEPSDTPERFLSQPNAAAERRYAEGELAGAIAAREGRYLVYEYGWPVGNYEELLCQKYGVEVLNQGCMGVAGRVDWESGFTKAVQRELERRYGRDVFAECRLEARQLSEARAACE